ncbi:Zn-ribbon domain-containing OB-fold protein [Streptomyces sp. NPDC003691]
MTAASPEIDDFTRPYWDAAAAGALLLRHCRACGKPHHYPREFCPYCWSGDGEWVAATGRATLYTWSVVHRNDLPPFDRRVPYIAAVVELEEGPRLMTEVVECEEGRLRIGMRLEVTFRVMEEEGEGAEGEGAVVVPVFRPEGVREEQP